MKIMNNNILIKALVNGLLGWALFAVLTLLKNPGMDIGQALIALPSIYTAAAAFIGCYIGYRIRENRSSL